MVCCIGGKGGFVLNLCSTPVEIEYLQITTDVHSGH